MAEEPEKDEHGLVIQKYEAMVLVVLPVEGYGEQTLRYARSCLYNVHVGTHSVARNDADLIPGALQDEFQVDEQLGSAVTLDDYAGVLFAGGPGAGALAEDADALRLARAAADDGKLLAAWGESVAVLVAAGAVKGKRVTGHLDLKQAVAAAGGRFTGVEVQRDGALVTARDEAAGMRFGRELVRVVAIL